MTELLTAPGSAPFTVALLVMLGLLLIELLSLFVGLGVNEVLDNIVTGNIDLPDAPEVMDVGLGELPDGMEGGSATPAGGSVVGRLLAWLYIGRVPVLIVLVLFLGIFGLFGLFAQTLIMSTFGHTLPAMVLGPIAFFACLPVVRWTAAGLSRVLPKDESNAISTDSFVGRTATLIGGDARPGMPSQARFRDRYGTTHYVMVEPETSDDKLENGSLVLLVRKLDSHFIAIPNPSAALAETE